MRQFDTGEQLAPRAAKGLAGVHQLLRDVADAQVGQADWCGDGEHHRRDQPRHHTQAEQGQGGDQVDEGRYRLHQVEYRAHGGIEHRFVRGEDAQRHADGHANHCGEGDLRQGFHGFLPVTQVEDQQE
ncbi:hypothetical protein D3C77_658680 [compost metagenome]